MCMPPQAVLELEAPDRRLLRRCLQMPWRAIPGPVAAVTDPQAGLRVSEARAQPLPVCSPPWATRCAHAMALSRGGGPEGNGDARRGPWQSAFHEGDT